MVDYALPLRFFAAVLTLLCITLAVFLVQRDPLPVKSTIQIDAVPRSQWPGVLTRTGVVCLLASYVLLLMACNVLLD